MISAEYFETGEIDNFYHVLNWSSLPLNEHGRIADIFI